MRLRVERRARRPGRWRVANEQRHLPKLVRPYCEAGSAGRTRARPTTRCSTRRSRADCGGGRGGGRDNSDVRPGTHLGGAAQICPQQRRKLRAASCEQPGKSEITAGGVHAQATRAQRGQSCATSASETGSKQKHECLRQANGRTLRATTCTPLQSCTPGPLPSKRRSSRAVLSVAVRRTGVLIDRLARARSADSDAAKHAAMAARERRACARWRP